MIDLKLIIKQRVIKNLVLKLDVAFKKKNSIKIAAKHFYSDGNKMLLIIMQSKFNNFFAPKLN